MNISGIRTYASFYDYNTIKQSELRSLQIQEAKASATQKTDVEEEISNVQEPVTVTGPDNGATDFVEQYQPDAVYEMKGADSDIHKLDIERAISDMKKDEVLLEYQFFVGNFK
ncbi:MAG: hypothetical protein IJZ23_07380 [Roseburia sp.]|nr:hypothetical protein [Roseburia sp.]